MKPILALFAVAVLIIVWGCGGAGGGTTTTTNNTTTTTTTGGNFGEGYVLDVRTGGPLAQPATVATGSFQTQTEPDGFFRVEANEGATSLNVSTPGTVGYGNWSFTTEPIVGTVDVGDLWVGPERVQLQGRVIDVLTNQPVAGAVVKFAGRMGTTNSSGRFTLSEVAYTSQTQATFWGIPIQVSAATYVSSEFSAEPNVAIEGVVEVGDLGITPIGDDTPPGIPFNIWGRINPLSAAPGTTVRCLQNGTEIRQFTVGSDGRYFLWVPPGTYTLRFQNGPLSAPDVQVELEKPNQVLRVDATLQ
ncbi:MAG: hypothetical protein ACK4P3_08880 [Fimbriimonadaceae bacterium]